MLASIKAILCMIAVGAFAMSSHALSYDTTIENCTASTSQRRSVTEADAYRAAKDENACAKRIMNRLLDVRLIALKKVDQKQFQAEMRLQKSFNQGVNKLVSDFNLGCSGTACRGCHPDTFLYYYRADMAILIAQSKLELQIRSSSDKSREVASRYFNDFANELCSATQLWVNEKAPRDCQKLVLGEIAFKLKGLISGENEGDVCAQLQ